MGAAFNLDSKGGHAIEIQLAGLEKAFGDLSPLTESFGVTLESFTVERFDTETAPDGSRWQQSIRAREQGGKTLTDSAQLRSSVHSRSGPASVELGTNKIYAGAHNQGMKIHAKDGGRLKFKLPGGLGFRSVEEVDLPKREFIPIGGLPHEYEAELIAQADDYARAAIGGAK